CLECHGDEEPEAGLRLTSRAHILSGGKSGPAAVAHRPGDSLVIRAVNRAGKLKMPPEDPLRTDEIAALTQWIERGMPWPESPVAATSRGGTVIAQAAREHWCFRPIADPALPAVRDPDWCRTSLDRFILAGLESAGLSPSTAADRRTLLRRAYYDLLGLPPTWEEVQAFIVDRSPDAFERVVDRLLASPRYGERWGRHWLDVARYADTKDGVLMYGDDRVRPYAYTYRDYVIRAFNEDLPFDRFIQEQLAADQIDPPVERWRLAGMGYLTLGRMYDNNVHDVIDDQIDTVTRGFLGLTVACARCHDHKYDPIPTADYYSLYGVFASSEAPLEPPLICEPESLAGGKEFEAQVAPKRQALRTFLDEQYTLLSEAARERIEDYLVHVATEPPDPLESAVYFLSLAAADLRPPIVGRWRHYLKERITSDDPVWGPWHDLMQIDAPATEDGAAGATDRGAFASAAAVVLEHWKSRPDGTGPGELNALVRVALASAPPDSPEDVARAYGKLLRRVYDESKAAVGSIGIASPPIEEPARKQLLDVLVSPESPAYFPSSDTRRYMSRQPKDQFSKMLVEIDRLAVKSPYAPPRAMVLYDSPTLDGPRILIRGNPGQPGQAVPRQFLAILSPGERTAFAHGSGRLDLAKAIASSDNPLTSRVIVNRVWMHHFGEPLVSTPSDFGARSSPPSHPELLDHLATRFVQEGWSLKRLHRLILVSSTYQQASGIADWGLRIADLKNNPGSIDPENRLLWRANRRRLDLEAMRDTLLAVSGRLSQRLAGRPVDVAGDPQCADRTVYALVDRQGLPGVFRTFDFATPDQSVERRPRTMVPQQALFALNSPFMLVQARALSARPEIARAAEPAAGVTALYRTVLAREPTQDELNLCLEFVAVPADRGSSLTTWEQLAQLLLASNEAMYLD
ncbi:MAG: PSD1 domain-containing protein, partial [Planctomycetes bacterium]|nr:PSD1 domain-containing protein [Planctomycetota bacterium]